MSEGTPDRRARLPRWAQSALRNAEQRATAAEALAHQLTGTPRQPVALPSVEVTTTQGARVPVDMGGGLSIILTTGERLRLTEQQPGMLQVIAEAVRLNIAPESGNHVSLIPGDTRPGVPPRHY